jgi:uncharacterized membrane protein YfcA
MNTSRLWLNSSLAGLRARGGLLAAYLYLVVGMCSLLVITVLLVAVIIAAILLAPAHLIRRALDWNVARRYMQNKTPYSSVETSSKSKPPM